MIGAPATASSSPLTQGGLRGSVESALEWAGLRTSHAHLIWLSGLLFFFLRAGDASVANVGETLFLKRIGPGWLPFAYIAQGVITLVILTYIGAAVDRGRRIEMLRFLIVGSALGPVLLRLLLLVDPTLATSLILVATEAVPVGITIALWSLFPDLIPGRAAHQVAVPVMAVGLLGDALGSAISAPLAYLIGIENLLLVASILAICALVTLRQLSRQRLIHLDLTRAPNLPMPNARATVRHLNDVTRQAYDFGRRSSLLRFLFFMIVASAALAPTLGYGFQVAANATFAEEYELLTFYSIFKSMLAVLAIVFLFIALGWLRRPAGVPRSLLVAPFGVAASLGIFVVFHGLAAAALPWAVQRVSVIAFDEPTRRFIYELFPAEMRDRIDWLISRTGRAIASIAGGLLVLASWEIGGVNDVTIVSVGIASFWMIVAIVFRVRYGRVVLATSLINRVEHDQRQFNGASSLLDDGAIAHLEREVVCGMPARALLAIDFLSQIGSTRLPRILAGSYPRQPPVLRDLFLATMQSSLRALPVGDSGAQAGASAIARLARTRLSDVERAQLIRIYSEAAVLHRLDSKQAKEFIDTMSGDEAPMVRLAVVAAAYRLDTAVVGDVLQAVLNDRLRSGSDIEIEMAINEIADLSTLDPARSGALTDNLLPLTDPAFPISVRLRAHCISRLAEIDAVIADPESKAVLDDWVVPLSLDADPRLASAAIDFLQSDRHRALLETHVLPNLTAGNHRVRERARETIRFFGTSAVPALLDSMRSGGRRERIAAGRLLGDYPVTRSAHHALIASEIDGLCARLIEAHFLGKHHADERLRFLTDRVTEAIDEHVRAVLRLLYADSGDERLIRLERELWSRDREIRRPALHRLAQVTGSIPDARLIHRLIDDRSLDQRVVEAHRRVADSPGSVGELLRRSASEGSWVTRVIACHTIAEIGDVAFADVLLEATGSHRRALREEAARAYKRLTGQPRSEEETMTTVERMLLLRQTELFRNLDARDLVGIAGILREMRYAPTDTIIREGDRGDFLAIIVSGDVDIVKYDGQGGQVVIRRMSKPNVIGEIALLDEGLRSASVIAATDSSLLLLSRDAFEALVEEYPGVALGIARVLSQRLQAATIQAARR